MVDVGPLGAEVADWLRLVSLPAFLWAASRDWQTRRVSNRLWPPLAALGVLALVVEGWFAYDAGGETWRAFWVLSAVSVVLMVGLGYLFWYLGAFGGADAKAVMVLGVVFPTVPTYTLGEWTLPTLEPTAGLFALAIVTNAAILAMVYPVGLALRNLVGGHLRPAMFIGRPVQAARVEALPGRLLETPDGFDRHGLDLDALRMYLAWRGCSLDELRDDPERYRREPPSDPGDPGDGAIADGGTTDDPWAAEAFVDALGYHPYGMDPGTIRDGLAVVTAREQVWYTPGIPFVVLLALGLLVAIAVGDLYAGVLGLVGLG